MGYIVFLQLFVLMSAPQNECIVNTELICLSGGKSNRALACLDCVTA